MIPAFLKQVFYLHSFSQLGEGQSLFLSLLFLKNNQPKTIPIPKRCMLVHAGAAQPAPIQRLLRVGQGDMSFCQLTILGLLLL